MPLAIGFFKDDLSRNAPFDNVSVIAEIQKEKFSHQLYGEKELAAGVYVENSFDKNVLLKNDTLKIGCEYSLGGQKPVNPIGLFYKSADVCIFHVLNHENKITTIARISGVLPPAHCTNI